MDGLMGADDCPRSATAHVAVASCRLILVWKGSLPGCRLARGRLVRDPSVYESLRHADS